MRKSNSEHEFITLLGRFFTEYLPVSVNASPVLSVYCFNILMRKQK